MWQRKIELGASYFAPSLLRAITTYNAAMFRRVDSEQSRSQDLEGPPDQPVEADSGSSVFATAVLPQLVEALQRRVAGGLPTFTAIDTVASRLDLDYLDRGEHSALLAPCVGRPENLNGTVILVGLLCRAAGELETELPLIGISRERLSSQWIRELDSGLKRQIQDKIAGDAYSEACALSELKSSFLYKSIIELKVQKERPVVTPPPARDDEVREQAEQLAEKATEEKAAPANARKREPLAPSARALVARGAVYAAATAAVALLALFVFPTGDLAGFSRAELDGVSQHLASGG